MKTFLLIGTIALIYFYEKNKKAEHTPVSQQHEQNQIPSTQ